MEAILSLLTTLNSLSPLAVIGLLGLVIYMMVKGKQDSDAQMGTLTENHLHELPGMAETLRRIEQKMGEEFAYIRAKINGK